MTEPIQQDDIANRLFEEDAARCKTRLAAQRTTEGNGDLSTGFVAEPYYQNLRLRILLEQKYETRDLGWTSES